MSKLLDNYQGYADAHGYEFQKPQLAIAGKKGEQPFVVHPLSVQYPYTNVDYSAYVKTSNGEPLSKDILNPLKREHKQILSVSHKNNLLNVRMRFSSNREKFRSQMEENMTAISELEQSNALIPCCAECAEAKHTSLYRIGYKYRALCSDCETRVTTTAAVTEQMQGDKSENIFAGIIGAFLGALLGAIVVLLILRLGYVAFWSGIILAVLTLKGYELLGKKLSPIGVIVSVIFMTIAIYLADRMDWAFYIVDWFHAFSEEISIFEAFRSFSFFMEEGYIDMNSYWRNLGQLALFTGIGAIVMTFSLLKSTKDSKIVEKII